MGVTGVGEIRMGERAQDGYVPVTVETTHGDVDLRWYESPGSSKAVVYVGGAGDGWDSPAREVYPRLAEELCLEGLHGLRLRFQNAHDLGLSTRDLLAGVGFLREHGVSELGLVGHSFGGAVVIRTGAMVPETRTVVALATQSFGAEPQDLPPHCSLLLIHGDRDPVLHPAASQVVYDLAHEPKRFILMPGTHHLLDEVSETVHDEVRGWLEHEMLGDAGG